LITQAPSEPIKEEGITLAKVYEGKHRVLNGHLLARDPERNIQ